MTQVNHIEWKSGLRQESEESKKLTAEGGLRDKRDETMGKNDT